MHHVIDYDVPGPFAGQPADDDELDALREEALADEARNAPAPMEPPAGLLCRHRQALEALLDYHRPDAALGEGWDAVLEGARFSQLAEAVWFGRTLDQHDEPPFDLDELRYAAAWLIERWDWAPDLLTATVVERRRFLYPQARDLNRRTATHGDAP